MEHTIGQLANFKVLKWPISANTLANFSFSYLVTLILLAIFCSSEEFQEVFDRKKLWPEAYL
jgi:hypothetical protein